MKIKDVMTAKPQTCSPDTTLAAAAALMWEADCGVLPVVEQGRLVGIVTDRDMYIALATRNTPASDVRVGEVARKDVVTCRPEDDVHAALATMRQARVRRVPVVGIGGALVGLLSMNDLLLATKSGGPVRPEEVVDTLQSICAHQRPAARVVAA